MSFIEDVTTKVVEKIAANTLDVAHAARMISALAPTIAAAPEIGRGLFEIEGLGAKASHLGRNALATLGGQLAGVLGSGVYDNFSGVGRTSRQMLMSDIMHGGDDVDVLGVIRRIHDNLPAAVAGNPVDHMLGSAVGGFSGYAATKALQKMLGVTKDPKPSLWRRITGSGV